MARAIISSPPALLSPEEYREHWEPQGWRLIIIGPTATWREDWGEWEAIRDIVQNSLDEAEKYLWGYDSDGLWIMDKGKGVAVADFLLGPPKLKPDYARGKFGEGMKIAALTLLRHGYSVHVRTVNREIWVIFLEQRTNGRAKTLAALWRPNGIRVGTEFHIIGYSGPAYEEYFAVNLPRSSILAQVPSPLAHPIRRMNQLIKAEGTGPNPEGGCIYARDIYMRNIASTFSYNLWGFDMAPDRHGPKNESDMWVDMGRLWSGVSNERLLQRFLGMVLEPPLVATEEGRRISMDDWSMGREPVSGKDYSAMIVEAGASWRAAWHAVAGFDGVIRTNPRWDGMVRHIGYKPIDVQWGVQSALSTVIDTDHGLVSKSQEALRQLEIVPDARLSQGALAHLNLARAIAREFDPDIKVHAAVIPPASARARTAGLYDMTTHDIFLHLETLEQGSTTVDAMIHELGHHIALLRTSDPIKAEDLQPAHSEAMTYVAARVVNYTADGRFDDYLKEAVW